VLCSPDIRQAFTAIFAVRDELNYPLSMPTEISIPDAEELKSRVRELRRFL
jgi:hypothetical protein